MWRILEINRYENVIAPKHSDYNFVMAHILSGAKNVVHGSIVRAIMGLNSRIVLTAVSPHLTTATVLTFPLACCNIENMRIQILRL